MGNWWDWVPRAAHIRVRVNNLPAPRSAEQAETCEERRQRSYDSFVSGLRTIFSRWARGSRHDWRMLLGMRTQQLGARLENGQNDDEEGRHEENCQRRRCQHTTQHTETDRVLAGCAGSRCQSQRYHTQDEGE